MTQLSDKLINISGIERIEIICERVPFFKGLYYSRVRHYVMKDHILNVYTQFEKYFQENFIKSEIESFKLFLLIHDIGKPIAYNNSNRDNQYDETIKLINKYKSELDLSDIDLILFNALLKSYSIGKYMENKISLEDTYVDIIEQASYVELPIKNFFYLLSVYYQCDIASYTKDAGGLPFLEHLFEYQDDSKIYCEKTKLLKLSDKYSRRYNLLLNKINETTEISQLKYENKISTVSTKNIQLKLVDKIDLSQFQKPKKEIRVDKENLYIIDTNVFIDYPEIISKIDRKYPVILSAKVVDELDNLKSKLNNEGKINVQKALKSLNMNIDKRDLRMEVADLSLIPIDFNRRSPDNFILSVVLKFKSENPILLTSDQGLQLKAKGLGLTTITLKQFLRQT